MNQQQRDFLIKKTDQTYEQEKTRLKQGIPKKPSLNNYLVAACLDNTIQFADIAALRDKIRNHVINMGNGKLLVETENGGRWRNDDDDDENGFVKLSAKDVFIIPENYKAAVREYEEKRKVIDDQIRELDAAHKTIVLKLQVGSSAVLDKIIEQVDNMGDLNLFNTNLNLIGKSEQPKESPKLKKSEA